MTLLIYLEDVSIMMDYDRMAELYFTVTCVSVQLGDTVFHSLYTFCLQTLSSPVTPQQWPFSHINPPKDRVTPPHPPPPQLDSLTSPAHLITHAWIIRHMSYSSLLHTAKWCQVFSTHTCTHKDPHVFDSEASAVECEAVAYSSYWFLFDLWVCIIVFSTLSRAKCN